MKRGFAGFTMLVSCALLARADLDLNGSWEFRFEEGKSYRESANPAFEATDAIPVPSCFDMLPKWLCKRGSGLYRRTFHLDAAVENAWLVIDGKNAVKATFRNGRASVRVPDFKLWSPDSPNLHTVALVDKKQSSIDNCRLSAGCCPLSARFGIRTIGGTRTRAAITARERTSG